SAVGADDVVLLFLGRKEGELVRQAQRVLRAGRHLQRLGLALALLRDRARFPVEFRRRHPAEGALIPVLVGAQPLRSDAAAAGALVEAADRSDYPPARGLGHDRIRLAVVLERLDGVARHAFRADLVRHLDVRRRRGRGRKRREQRRDRECAGAIHDSSARIDWRASVPLTRTRPSSTTRRSSRSQRSASGYMRCSCLSTRAASAVSVSPARTGTAAWTMIGPWST